MATVSLYRDIFKGEHSLAGDGVLADEVEVESHAFLNDPAHLPHHQIDPYYLVGIGVLGAVQNNVEHALSNSQFVHLIPFTLYTIYIPNTPF